MLKIGITQRVQNIPSRRERWDCIDQAWISLLLGLGYLPIPLPNEVELVCPLLQSLKLDGVILSGGNDLRDLPSASNVALERDLFEKKLLESCLKQNLPVLGICRGMQLLVSYAGGTLTRLPDHVGVSHPIRKCGGTVLPLPDTCIVNSYHNYGFQEDGLGGSFEAAAVSLDGFVEAVVHRRSKQWGLMWHPERGGTTTTDCDIIKTLFGTEV